MAGPQTPVPGSKSPSLSVSGLLFAAPQLFRVQPRPGTEPAAALPPPPLPPPRAPEAGWPRPRAHAGHAPPPTRSTPNPAGGGGVEGES